MSPTPQHLNQIMGVCFNIAADRTRLEASAEQCSNVGLRLPRVRGLCASMVQVTNFLQQGAFICLIGRPFPA